MPKSIGLIIFIFILAGCSATKKIDVPDTGITVIDYGADRRGSYLLKTTGGKYFIVSEPSPDVSKEITTSLGLSADTIENLVKPELKAEYANKVVNLANRSQTLQVLRESLFRLSEMSASSDINTKGSRKNNTTLIEANIFIMRAAIKSVVTINGLITNKNTTKAI